MEKENQCSDLIVKAAIKRKPRFKPGSELSGTVNKQMNIEVNDVSTEDTEAFDVTMQFRVCANGKGAENANS